MDFFNIYAFYAKSIMVYQTIEIRYNKYFSLTEIAPQAIVNIFKRFLYKDPFFGKVSQKFFNVKFLDQAIYFTIVLNKKSYVVT